MTQSKFSFPILSMEEISAKLKPLRSKRGLMPPDGEGLTLSAIGQYLGWNHYRLYTAVQGIMSEESQVKLSRFFHRWESGEIVFIFRRPPRGVYRKPDDGFGWTVHYPEYPIPRNVPKPGNIQVNFKTGKLERKSD